MRQPQAGMAPLPPQRKWRAITIATVVLVPAFWAMLAGFVAAGSDREGGVGNPAAAVAFGFAVIPFAFIALAFLSEHPRAPGAVLRAMVWCLLVGGLASAVAADVVTGFVAGIGAGGVTALRADEPHTSRSRALAVAVVSVYVFVLARTAGDLVLLAAPVFPFTALGVADHLAERRADRASAAARSS
ncbi:MAG TPA: hypothetical protein VM262_01265 [Acidimicrobiales bacterium]|nr:hypothetical protein [Acidimicrobiales bacterium]